MALLRLEDLSSNALTILDENDDQVCGAEQTGEVEELAFEYFQE